MMIKKSNVLAVLGLCMACIGIFSWLDERAKPEKLSEDIEEYAPKTQALQRRTAKSDASLIAYPSTVEQASARKTIDPKASEAAFQEDITEAIGWYHSGDIEQAITHLQALVEKNSQRDEAQALLGELLQDKGDSTQAYIHLRRALDLNPTNTRALLLLPEVLEHPIPGRPLAREDAYALFKELETANNSPALQLGLGKMELSAKDLASALSRFEQASRAPDLLVEATLEASVAYLKHGQAEKALELYARNIEVHKTRGQGLPEDWEDLRINYASTLLELKKYDEAQKQLEALEAEKPEADTAWIHKSLNEARGS